MKERALELAKKLEWYSNYPEFVEAGEMIRRLVEELDRQEQECWCGGHSFAYLRAKGRLPQTKPLSDEEINQIWRTVLADSLSWDGLQKKTTVDIEFARAIEERHGIK